MSIRIKTGETLSWLCTDDSGDLTGYTIEAALRRGGFYKQLSVEAVDLSIGQFKLTAAKTSDLPIGTLDCDLKYTQGGETTYSDTFKIYVAKGITK